MPSFLRTLRKVVQRRPRQHEQPVNPFPDLPVDLHREIFETAAIRDAATALVLLRVAKHVRSWVEPLVYNTLELHVPKLLVALKAKSPHFLQTNVRNLRLHGSVPAATIALALERCTGVSNLCALGIFPASMKTLAAYLGTTPLPLRRLAANEHFLATLLTTESLAAGMWRGITHLDAPHGRGAGVDWVALLANGADAFANLTHLRVWHHHQTPEHRAAVQHILDSLGNLRVLIVVPEPETHPSEVAQFLDVDDVRLVVMPLDVNGAIKDWRARALKGEKDLWERAEEFVAQRRRGEVNPPSRCWLLAAGQTHIGNGTVPMELPSLEPSTSGTIAESRRDSFGSIETPTWADEVLTALSLSPRPEDGALVPSPTSTTWEHYPYASQMGAMPWMREMREKEKTV